MYLMVLEIICIALVVFIFSPMFYIMFNLTLLLLGRHPIQNAVNPDIGKLRKSHVEHIPLVFFIPSPPEDENKPFAVPKPSYTYPPKPAAPPTVVSGRQFGFLRKYRKKEDESLKADTSPDEPKAKVNEDVEGEEIWEDQWEKCDFPFVRLDKNRASCAICLLDFEAPPMKEKEAAQPQPANPIASSSNDADTSIPIEGVTNIQTWDMKLDGISSIVPEEHEHEHERTDAGEPILTDAGEGVQPLRLLQCGHVFHVCLSFLVYVRITRLMVALV